MSNFINSLSPKKQHELQRWYTISIISMYLVGAVLLSISLYQFWKLLVIKKEQAQLIEKVAPFNKLMDKEVILQKKQQMYAKRIAKLVRYRNRAHNPARYLEEIAKIIPDDVCLTSLHLNKKTIEMVGDALTSSSITTFLTLMQKSKRFATIQLILLEQSPLESEGKQLLRFTINGSIQT